MVSDSTGPAAAHRAAPPAITQDTYGTFDGPSPFGDPDGNDADDLKRLFASQPARDLAFRYGYPDKARSRPPHRDTAPGSGSARSTPRRSPDQLDALGRYRRGRPRPRFRSVDTTDRAERPGWKIDRITGMAKRPSRA